MRIAFVSSYFSEGMGYTENMLPKALALLGHEVQTTLDERSEAPGAS